MSAKGGTIGRRRIASTPPACSVSRSKRAKAGARYHAIAEQGVPFRDIAAVIARRLGVPAVSKTPEAGGRAFRLVRAFRRDRQPRFERAHPRRTRMDADPARAARRSRPALLLQDLSDATRRRRQGGRLMLPRRAPTRARRRCPTSRLPTASNAPRREPIFAVPSVVVALIAALIGAYAVFDFLAPATQDAALSLFAFLPGRLTLAIWPERLSDLIARASGDPNALAEATLLRHYHLVPGAAQPWTLLTYAFMHGSWTHVLLNSRLARRLRPAGRAPLRRAALSRLLRAHRRGGRADPLGLLSDGFRAADRRLGRRFGADGRRDALHLRARRAARLAARLFRCRRAKPIRCGRRRLWRNCCGSGARSASSRSGWRPMSSSAPARRRSALPTRRSPGSPMSAASSPGCWRFRCSTARRLRGR